MTARSVVLSLLLGAPERGLAARDVVAMGREFGLVDTTVRAALSRMVATGDLVTRDSVYRLAARHLRRQEAQEAALHPDLRPWDGTWTVLVVTGTGRDAAARADLRRAMAERRMAELREGVWTRPDNVAHTGPIDAPDADVVRMRSRPDDDTALVARLWDTASWVTRAHALLAAAGPAGSLRDRFVTNAAIVRHLRADPWLPPELLPADWPADELRSTYEGFRTELRALHTADPRVGAPATV